MLDAADASTVAARVSQARAEGLDAGGMQGFTEGLLLGLQKGNQIGHQVGFMSALAESEAALAAERAGAGAPASPAASKLPQLAAQIVQAAARFPLENHAPGSASAAAPGDDLVSRLETLTGRMKTLLATSALQALPAARLAAEADPVAFSAELERAARRAAAGGPPGSGSSDTLSF